MFVESQTRRAAASHEHLRHKDGHAVDAYWMPTGEIEVWVNDGPPKTHYTVTEEQYEHLLATGQIG